MNDSTNLLIEALPYSGGHEARRRRHLDLHHEELPHPLRRRRVDADDGGRRLRPVGHQEAEGDQGALDKYSFRGNLDSPLNFPLSSKLRGWWYANKYSVESNSRWYIVRYLLVSNNFLRIRFTWFICLVIRANDHEILLTFLITGINYSVSQSSIE